MSKTIPLIVCLLKTVACSVLPAGYPCMIFESETPSNGSHCRPTKLCDGYDAQRYRTIDGTCNNIKMNTLWGSAGSEFARLVDRRRLVTFGYPPLFRLKFSRRFLPSAREVSSRIHGGIDETSKTFTSMLMQFGQILDHDTTLTAEMNMCHLHEGCVTEEMDCCELVEHFERPKACYPINIPENDAFYRAHFPKPTCLDFKRSLPFPCNYTTQSEDREQFNEVTSYVDASFLYHSDPEKAIGLRSLAGGLLTEGKLGLMPFEKSSCQTSAHLHPQFLAGDIRANENPGLQTHHTLWLREHNRLAESIKNQDPSLLDENVFQEARRLVIAQWQNVVFSEFLPKILGDELILGLELSVNKPSIYKEYLKPAIFNVFATAAFRFGHSLVPGKINMMFPNQTTTKKNLEDNFFSTKLVIEGNMDEMLQGMCFLDAEMPNNVVNDALRNFLFKVPGKTYGADLVARNIQRGRDHELASYNSYRQACGLRSLPGTFFSQPPPEISSDLWSKFARVYHSPFDIEIFPGGMSERHIRGGIIGPTFACILGDQFRRLKLADRYFFTHVNVGRNIRFCKQELDLIRKRTFRDILCDNTNIADVSKDPFVKIGPNNPLQSCSERNLFEPTVNCKPVDNHHDAFLPITEVVKTDGNHGKAIFMAGGFSGKEILDSVELYSPNGTCQYYLQPLPVPTHGATAIYAMGTILVCGGRTQNGIAGKHCWRYVRNNAIGSWEKTTDTSTWQPRWLSAGAYTQERYYVTGGWSSPNTTEYYDFSRDLWFRYKPISNNWRRHCMIYFQNMLVLLGGSTTGSKVIALNLTNGIWTDLADIASFRESHSCIVIPNTSYVLIIGGTSVSILYDIDSGRTIYGVENAISRSHGSLIELQGSVYAIGGDSHSNRVEKYDQESQTFQEVDTPLKQGRSRFGIAKVPVSMFGHLPRGCEP